MDPGITHPQECGEAIKRWNEQVGSRFLLTPDKGIVQIRIFERNSDEWPFTEWRVNGTIAAGFALNYDSSGNMLGTNPGLIARSDIYVNRVLAGYDYQSRVYTFAHEMGHAFGLDDHPSENINSVMSYQSQGRLLLGPSFEDIHGIAHIYGLHDLLVRPDDLEGIENIKSIWHYDRYGKGHSHLRGWSRFRGFFPSIFGGGSGLNDLESIEAYETYYVQVKAVGTSIFLGFGRFRQQVFPGISNSWTYR